MAAVTPESGTGTTMSASTGDFQRELAAHGVAALAAPSAQTRCCRDARNTRARRCSSTCGCCRRVEARVHPFRPDDDQLTRLHFALVSRADQIEGAGLGREHNGICLVRRLAGNACPSTSGRKPRGSRAAKMRSGVMHHQRECALDAAQRVGHGSAQRLLAWSGRSGER